MVEARNLFTPPSLDEIALRMLAERLMETKEIPRGRINDAIDFMSSSQLLTSLAQLEDAPWHLCKRFGNTAILVYDLRNGFREKALTAFNDDLALFIYGGVEDSGYISKLVRHGMRTEDHAYLLIEDQSTTQN